MTAIIYHMGSDDNLCNLCPICRLQWNTSKWRTL